MASAPWPRITERYALRVLRMHGQIGDRDLAHVGAEQRRNLLIECRGSPWRPARRRCAAVPSSSAKIAADCASAGEQHAVGTERQRPDRLERRPRSSRRIGHRSLGRRRHRERRDCRQHQKCSQQQRLHSALPKTPNRPTFLNCFVFSVSVSSVSSVDRVFCGSYCCDVEPFFVPTSSPFRNFSSGG